MMTQEISTAKVRVKMKGLGVVHLHTDSTNQKNTWEILFLRGIPKHNLKIIIKEHRKDLTTPIETVYPIPDDTRNLSFNTKEASTTTGSHECSGPDFNWKYGVDEEHDARWIVDLSELHGSLKNLKPIKIKKKYTERKLTYLTISEAVFYCYDLSKEKYEFEQAGNIIKEPRNVGLWLGFDIGWNKNGETEVDIDYMKRILEPHDKLEYYEIVIDNDCNCDTNDVDFDVYYRELVDEYEIIEHPPHPAGRVDCHLVKISEIADESGQARNSLSELL